MKFNSKSKHNSCWNLLFKKLLWSNIWCMTILPIEAFWNFSMSGWLKIDWTRDVCWAWKINPNNLISFDRHLSPEKLSENDVLTWIFNWNQHMNKKLYWRFRFWRGSLFSVSISFICLITILLCQKIYIIFICNMYKEMTFLVVINNIIWK
jgi:hypothetical protein